MTLTKVLYTAGAAADGGRDGRVRSTDGVLDLGLQAPVELGGRGGAATNPEQLFAAGYAACFHSALTLVARGRKVRIDGSQVHAEVDLGADTDDGFGIAVRLRAELPGVDPAVAEDLVAAAHQACPYSKATRGNIDVTLEVTTGAAQGASTRAGSA